jgi:polysaccharide pyruvyl transferase WcaK-like protein
VRIGRPVSKAYLAAGRLLNLRGIVLGGGTLIKYFFDDLVEQIVDAFPDKRFIVFGTGVADHMLWESFGDSIDTARWCELLNRSAFVGVRGPKSEEHLRTWGFRGDVEIVGDLATWFVADEIRPHQKSKKIGLNIGPTFEKCFGRSDQVVLEATAAILRRLASEGWEITLFPMIANDIEFMKEAVKRAGVGPLRMHRSFLDVGKTLKAMGRQDVFIGEKLHSVILAHCSLVPSVMLGYRTKCADYMQSVGQELWHQRTDRLDPSEILDMLTNLYCSQEFYREQLSAELHRLKSNLRESSNRVAELLSCAS